MVIPFLFLTLIVVALAPTVVFGDAPWGARWYAISQFETANITGFKADIATADPDVESGLSLETIWVHGPGYFDWVEVGWVRLPEHRRMYSYCSPTDTCLPQPAGYDWYETPVVGSIHNYRIEHISGFEWRVYVDDELRRTVAIPGFERSGFVTVGGEVSDNDNEMGVSGLLNVRYEINDDGVWRVFDGEESADDGYWIVELWGTHDNMQNGTCQHAEWHC